MKETPEARYLAIDGSLVFVDISGFTALTERLARQGKIGAELMRDTLDGVFTALLDEAYDWGAGLLKWGGDALLLLFDGPGHARRARPRLLGDAADDRAGGTPQGHGRHVVLRMSIGITTGTLRLLHGGKRAPGAADRGPGATETVTIEAIADAGEIGISHALAALLDPACVGPAEGAGAAARRAPGRRRGSARPTSASVDGIDIASCIPIAARAHVLLNTASPSTERSPPRSST